MEYRWDILTIDCITLSLATEVANIASADWESFKQWAPFVEDEHCEKMWTNTRDNFFGWIQYKAIALKTNEVFNYYTVPMRDKDEEPWADWVRFTQLFGFAY